MFKRKLLTLILLFFLFQGCEFIREEVRRVLKEHGILLFQTPNKYINIPWEIFIHKSLHKYKEYHVSLQSCRSLISLLENSGFDEIVIEKRDAYTKEIGEETKTDGEGIVESAVAHLDNLKKYYSRES